MICSSVTSGIVTSSFATGATSSRCAGLGLQIAVHEVDLLQAAKALADVLRPDLADSVDGLQLAVSGGEELVEAPELPHDLVHEQLRQTRDAPEDPVAPRGDGIIEGVELPVIAEELGQPTEVEQVLVGQAGELVEDRREASWLCSAR